MKEKRNIFDILEESKSLIEELWEGEGELTEDLEERLAINRNDVEEKVENYYYIISEFKAKEDFLKQQIDRLNVKKKGYAKIQERLAETIDKAMSIYAPIDPKSKASGFKTRKLELPTVTASAVSYPVLSEDSLKLVESPETQLPSKYINYTLVGSTVKEEDKLKIEKALESTGLQIRFTSSIDANLAKDALKAEEVIPIRDVNPNDQGDLEIVGYLELSPNYKTRFK